MNIDEIIMTLKLAKAEVEWNYPLDYAEAIDSAIAIIQEKKAKICNKKFTKNDLLTGDFVKCSDGSVRMYSAEMGTFVGVKSSVPYNYYNDGLIDCINGDNDIVAVRRPITVMECSFDIFDKDNGIILYEYC